MLPLLLGGCNIQPSSTPALVPTLLLNITSTPSPLPIYHYGKEITDCTSGGCHVEVVNIFNATPVAVTTPEGGHPQLLTGFCGGPACHIQATIEANPFLSDLSHTNNHRNLDCLSCHAGNNITLQNINGRWIPTQKHSSLTGPLELRITCPDCHAPNGELKNIKIHDAP